jgi:hypothetical protein
MSSVIQNIAGGYENGLFHDPLSFIYGCINLFPKMAGGKFREGTLDAIKEQFHPF